MSPSTDSAETILIVDDEQSVRTTFQQWLDDGRLGCRILSVPDAETALVEANRQPIDLAILDWNLGAGNDGLQLLEDLYLFNPDLVAIMITGYAQQATPLDAMRMGVRDYLDKNQDLDRDRFLATIRKQLGLIRPARRERRFHQNLKAFREAVVKVLPLVQSAAALTDPVPLPDAIRSLMRFLLQMTEAQTGVLVVRTYDSKRQPPEICRVYDSTGALLDAELIPFARSIAGSAVSLQKPSAMIKLDQLAASATVDLQPFERGRHSLLACPLPIAPGVQVVWELFDKQAGADRATGGFSEKDLRIVGSASEMGIDLLRQALAHRQIHQVLMDSIAVALDASDKVTMILDRKNGEGPEQPPPTEVLDRLSEGFRFASGTAEEAKETVRLAEAIRMLARGHGIHALRHCTRLVDNLREFLNELPG